MTAIQTQNPHLLTLDEMHVADVCWMEIMGDDTTFSVCTLAWYFLIDGNETEIQYSGEDDAHFYKDADYGRTWRCWNMEPTVEQMEAIEWND